MEFCTQIFFIGTNSIKIFVLDEADEMLSRGFKEQIYQVFRTLAMDVQVILLSATMPAEVFDVTKKFMRNPIKILVKKEELTLEGIAQFFLVVPTDDDKFVALTDLYSIMTVSQAVIFCNTRKRVQWLANSLKEQDYTVSTMVIIQLLIESIIRNEFDLVIPSLKSTLSEMHSLFLLKLSM